MIVCFYAAKITPIYFTSEELAHILPEFTETKSVYVQVVGTWRDGLRIFGVSYHEYLNHGDDTGYYKLGRKTMGPGIAYISPSWGRIDGLRQDDFNIPSRGVLATTFTSLEKGDKYLQAAPLDTITPFSWSDHPLKSKRSTPEPEPVDVEIEETAEEQVEDESFAEDLFVRREEPTPEELRTATPVEATRPQFAPVDRTGPIRQEADKLKSPEEIRYYVRELNQILATSSLIISFDKTARALQLEERIVEYEEF